MSVRILIGDVRDKLKELPADSVDCVGTSPPYWGLRDYGIDGQLGLEPTWQEHVAVMVEIFAEVRRIMKPTATLWLNYGDSYCSTDKWGGGGNVGKHSVAPDGSVPSWQVRNRRALATGLKPKDLCGIPWRVAFALQADGWWLRQDIIWSKPNPMPESVTDRCTKAHEYMFLLTKSARYYFDATAIAETAATSSIERLGQPNLEQQAGSSRVPGKTNGNMKAVGGETRNKRSVWEVATQPFSEAHFATFPPALIEPCIKAGCPEKCCAKCGGPWVRKIETTLVRGPKGNRDVVINARALAADDGDQGSNRAKDGHKKGWLNQSKTLGFSPSCNCNAGTIPGLVLDPFGGAGTTGLVADRLGRNAILIELNPKYAELARRRLNDDAGMFAQVAAE